ncbi:hypothetical protein [Streptomyces sp. NPDC001761]
MRRCPPVPEHGPTEAPRTRAPVSGAAPGRPCSLARDTATARRHLGVPDPELGRAWSALLAKGRDAARACTSVLDSDTDDVRRNTKMPEDLDAAYEQATRTVPLPTERVTTALEQWPRWKKAG